MIARRHLLGTVLFVGAGILALLVWAKRDGAGTPEAAAEPSARRSGESAAGEEGPRAPSPGTAPGASRDLAASPLAPRLFEATVYRLRTELGPDSRPLVGVAPVFAEERVAREVPAVFLEFRSVLERLAQLAPERRASLWDEALALAKVRAELWPELARADPEAALLLSPGASERALLSPPVLALLEQPVAGVGFYGVRATCNHGPEAEGHDIGCRIDHDVILGDRVYQAHIYGERRSRLTEEEASLYGVAMGDVLALHADDFVLLAGNRSGSGAESATLVHRGKKVGVPAPITPQAVQAGLAHFDTP